MSQTTLFDMIEEKVSDKSPAPKTFSSAEWGTFKDSLRAPIHNWFPYPAGFSNKAVEHAIKKFSITQGHLIYDPFTGTGTTNVVAKSSGIGSIGMEAHPFIYFVAKTKTHWEIQLQVVLDGIDRIEKLSRKIALKERAVAKKFPELVGKCFSKNTLASLYGIRESIKTERFEATYTNFFNLALACILRPCASVATGWPYIAPNKKKTGNEKDVFKTFSEMTLKMYGDIQRSKTLPSKAKCDIVQGDARNTTEYVEDSSADLIFTSPPYLNNYDYADRTRLEMYFFGWANDWGGISQKVRTKLIMSATTQINRGQYRAGDLLLPEIKKVNPKIARQLQMKIDQLSSMRDTKGGKKSYDILVGGYFNDMFQVLVDCFRILKKGRTFALILGDSAPYGVHIPTETFLGEMGLSIGFRDYDVEMLRRRGEKWKGNPQRHKIPLRESILYLDK